MILLAGCGQQTRPVSTAQYYNPAKETAADTEEAEGAGAETSIGTDLYLIIGNDMTNEQLNLKQLASGKQYLYVYSLSTDFWINTETVQQRWILSRQGDPYWKKRWRRTALAGHRSRMKSGNIRISQNIR